MDRPISVLHVDDDPSITDLTGTFLEREDDRFTVETATSADEGMVRITDRPPDCVVSDYNMPGMDGIEFLQAVREEYPDLPFILYTGKGSEAVASEAIAADVTDYLQKESGSEQYELLANRILNAVETRREAERADRQEQLIRLTEFAGDTGGFELDTETGELLLTDGVRRLIDRSAGADLSLTEAIDLYHPEDREDIRQTIDRARQTGEQTHGTWRLQAQDGDERLVDVTVTPAPTDGDTEILRGSIHDITERKERQRELEQIETVFEHAQDALFLVDVGEEFTAERVNPAWEELTGLTAEQASGQTAQDIFDQQAGELVEDKYHKCVQRREPLRYKETIRLNGEQRHFVAQLAPIIVDGNVEYIAGSTRDVTDRKERERKLKRERERYAKLFETLPNPVLHVRAEDGEPIVETVNPAFEDTFGYDAEAIRNEPIQEYVLPDDRDDATRQLNRRVLREGEVRTEVQRETTDGVRTFQLNVRIHNTESEDYEGYAVYTDITERKERERELEDQNERLDEFASIVSHDLRSPLSVAEGHLELAAETVESAHLGEASDAIKRSQALIDDLLALARGGDQVGETEPVELAKVAESSWQTVETRQATLDADESGVIAADRSRLQQLFENLYRNAVEHGDDVTVSIGVMDEGFYVADTGPGIPESDREDVFEAGYSTNEDGTGFGLRIVEQIAGAHGWEVTVTESEQGGARFEFTGVERVE